MNGGQAHAPHDRHGHEQPTDGRPWATDAEIDRLASELHGLTDEEIRIAREATTGG